MLKVNTINFEDPEKIRHKVHFDNLTAALPNERFKMELDVPTSKDMSARVIDLVAPLGKGQRGLIVAPPRTGKTVLCCCRTSPFDHCEPFFSRMLPDRAPDRRASGRSDRHAALRARRGRVLDIRRAGHPPRAGRRNGHRKAKRLVEHGRDVVILLDSITRLGRAYNTVVPSSGKVLTGGVDANALQRPKRFFGAARNIEEGGR